MSRTSRLGSLMALGQIWAKTLFFWHILHWEHCEKAWQYGRTWIFSLVSSVLHPSFAFPLPSRVEKEFITSSRHPSRRWTSDWSNGECEDSRHTKKKTRVTLKYPHFYLSPLFWVANFDKPIFDLFQGKNVLSEQKHVLNVFGRTSTRLLFKSTSERNSEIRVCKVRITWTGDHDRTNLLTGVLCEAAAYGLRDSPKLWSGLYYTSEQTTLVNSCECETRQPKKKENVEINIYIWRAKKTQRKSCQYTTDRGKMD